DRHAGRDQRGERSGRRAGRPRRRQEAGGADAACEDDRGQRTRRSAGKRQNRVAEAFHAKSVAPYRERIRGSSVITPSTPSSSRRSATARSFTVHAKTATPSS